MTTLLDLMMDTDVLKERIINGALADVFKRSPITVAVPRQSLPPLEAEAKVEAEVEVPADPIDGLAVDLDDDATPL